MMPCAKSERAMPSAHTSSFLSPSFITTSLHALFSDPSFSPMARSGVYGGCLLLLSEAKMRVMMIAYVR